MAQSLSVWAFVFSRQVAFAFAYGLALSPAWAQNGHLPKPPQIAPQNAVLLRSFPLIGATDLAFLPESRLAIANDSLQIWSYATGKRLKNVTVQEFPTLQNIERVGQSSQLAGLWFSDPDRDLGGSALAFWDWKTARWTRIQKAPNREDADFSAFSLAPDGRILATAQTSTATHDFRPESQKRGRVVLWRTSDGKRIRTLARERVYRLVWSRDGRFLAGASDNHTLLWSLGNGQKRRLKNPNAWTLRFSPDGKTLATLQTNTERIGGRVRLWDVASGKRLRQNAIEWSQMGDLQWTRDGQTLLLGGGSPGNLDSKGRELDPARGEVLFLRARDLKLQRRLSFAGGEVSRLELASDGKTFATIQYGDTKDDGVKIWRLP